MASFGTMESDLNPKHPQLIIADTFIISLATHQSGSSAVIYGAPDSALDVV
jgi:hypothetical protein